jgi:hypothetical protein
MNRTQIDVLESLRMHGGWSLYQTLLRDKFNIEYAKLRKSRRNDVGYGKICGMLDGIEYSLAVIDNIINEGVDEPQPQ